MRYVGLFKMLLWWILCLFPCFFLTKSTPCFKDGCNVTKIITGIKGICSLPKVDFGISLQNEVKIKCFQNDPSYILDCFSQINVSSYHFTSCDLKYFRKRRDTIRMEIVDSRVTAKYLRNFKSLKYLSVVNSELRNLTEDTLLGLPLLHLELFNCSLDFIFPKFFSLSSMLSIQLSRNPLRQIPDDVFHGLHQLTNLDLTANHLQDVSTILFRDLTSLEVLNLSKNHLFSIPSDLFNNNKKLKKIILNDNKLFKLPNELLLPSDNTLLYLDLSGNKNLKYIPNNFGKKMKQLKILHISNCSLSEVSIQFIQDVHRLEQLNLAGNMLDNLPNDLFIESHFLRRLDLTNNRLRNLPDFLFKDTPSLEEIHLSFNYFETIPEKSIFHLSRLRLLNMSYNKINVISLNSLSSELMNLETLDLSHNVIEKAYFDFNSGYKELRFLNLSHNYLRSPPTIVSSFREKLKIIDLDFNYIRNLVIPSMVPYDVTYFIRHNNIQSIHIDRTEYFKVTQMMLNVEFLGRRVNSSTYFLQGNKIICDCFLREFFEFWKRRRGFAQRYPVTIKDIHEIKCYAPSELRDLKFVKINGRQLICEMNGNCPSNCNCFTYEPRDNVYVNCSGRDFLQIPFYFPYNTSVIDLSHNLLQYFDLNNMEFYVLDTLRELNLSINSLLRINGDFEKSGITTLDLRNNLFKSPPKGIRNMSLYFENNPIRCDCHNFQLKNWLNENTLIDIHDITCVREDQHYSVKNIFDVNICTANIGIAIKYNTNIILILLIYIFIYILKYLK